jgi:RsiW-degrading membrane proteinase PrsW (M82 family)
MPVVGPPPSPDPYEYATAAQALAAAPARRRVSWLNVVGLVVIILLIAAGGIFVLVTIGYNGGVQALIVGTAAAIIPVPLLVFCFLWLDRYEPEPVKYLLFCFAWGSCVATAVALYVNTHVGDYFKAHGISDNLVAVLCAPAIEETMKAAGPLLLFFVRRKQFSGFIDAIVYCGLSATGFAMVENILYLGVKGYAAGAHEDGALGGARALAAIFVARIVMTGFAHPLFTSMTGIGLGFAVRSSSKAVRYVAPFAALIVAMMLHGSWNLMSVVASQSAYVILYGYFAVMMPIFLGMVTFTLWLRSNEGRLAERILPDYVRAGWFSPPEIAALGTVGRRLSAKRWAKRVAGDAGAKAMKAFQFDATRLALLRDRMRRGIGTAPGKELTESLQEERVLLDGLMAYRRVFAGRDPLAPTAIWDGARYHVTFPDGVVRPINAPSSPVAPVPVVLGGGPAPMPIAPAYPYR